MKDLETKQVLIRPLLETDKQTLALLANNINVWNHLRDIIPHPYNEKDAENFIKQCSKENPTLTFAIEFQNKCVGVIGLVKHTDVYRLGAELGYWIGEPYWNKGIATEAVKLILEYAFQKLKLIRVHASVYDFNKSSIRVLEKCNFELEGIMKKAIIKNQLICDEYVYAKINC